MLCQFLTPLQDMFLVSLILCRKILRYITWHVSWISCLKTLFNTTFNVANLPFILDPLHQLETMCVPGGSGDTSERLFGHCLSGKAWPLPDPARKDIIFSEVSPLKFKMSRSSWLFRFNAWVKRLGKEPDYPPFFLKKLSPKYLDLFI